ncbi:MAG TPA: hypothetical protein VGM56_31765 [Byssovorax sp.]
MTEVVVVVTALELDELELDVPSAPGMHAGFVGLAAGQQMSTCVCSVLWSVQRSPVSQSSLPLSTLHCCPSPSFPQPGTAA